MVELGRAFSINEHSVFVFSESLIRSHLMFQFSKCLESILGMLRIALKLPPYIVISSGKGMKA